MPTYQYGCSKCGHDFEVVQSFTDTAITKCPECGGQVRKKFSSVGVVFKGSGFYRNDSREKKTTAEAPAKKEEKAKEAPKKESKTETKSTKPEKKASTPKKDK